VKVLLVAREALARGCLCLLFASFDVVDRVLSTSTIADARWSGSAPTDQQGQLAEASVLQGHFPNKSDIVDI
jgi:hypothetical protein